MRQDPTACCAGFDLGGTHLKYGLIDEGGAVVFESTANSPERIKDLLKLLEKLWKSLKEKKPVSAAGFGIPGIFHLQEQKILQSPNYPSLDNFDLIPALSRFLNVPFSVNNDANMAAYGEFKQGAGRHAQSMVLLTIGTGVGSGLILDQTLWQGACGFAGELGHLTVNPNGESCNCGSQGCLETEVSGPKIVKNYKALTKRKNVFSAKEVAQRAKQGDRAAVEAFAQAGRFLGIGLSIVINLLNPEIILLGGGVTGAGEFFLPKALDEARRRSYKPSFESCRIIKTALGNRAGFIGAALWAKEHMPGSSF